MIIPVIPRTAKIHGRTLNGALGVGCDGREKAVDACAFQNVSLDSELDQFVVQDIAGWRKIDRSCWQSQFVDVERIDSKNILMSGRNEICWRAWTIISVVKEKVAADLLTKLASNHTGVFRKPSRLGRDVVHSPMCETRRAVVQDYCNVSDRCLINSLPITYLRMR